MSKPKRITGAVIFSCLTLAVMVLIFMFSCDDGEESAEISESLLDVIIAFVGKFVSHNTLRKIAHFCEFTALGFCSAGFFKFTFCKDKFYYPLIFSAVYAVTDEIHQYFVPGRACRLFDVFIDSCGALTGIGVFLLISFITVKLCKKSHEVK